MSPPPEPTSPSAQTAPNAVWEQLERSPTEALGLVILWSTREPHRVGEIALLDEQVPLSLLGRTTGDLALSLSEIASRFGSDQAQQVARSTTADQPLTTRLCFRRQRPTELGPEPPPVAAVACESISRLQVGLFPREQGIWVHNVGRCPLAVNGSPVQSALVQAGDTLYLRGQLLLLCVHRPTVMPALRAYPPDRVHPFGSVDVDGMIGESPAMWHLRERLAACARGDQNVLIIGESGSGKELAAQAIHRLSSRRGRPLIADNISAIPPSLAAALLFGNKRNFPNPGMEERAGLIGAADGSMLFLDEIGDMPEEVQPMFLRVADRHGEYFRLGEEGRSRRSDFRLLGATNRPERIRYELKRRFQREIRIPSLNERREDITLLVRHILQAQVNQGDLDALRFWNHEERQARVHPLLLEQLVRHRYVTNVSEVEFLLGYATAESTGDVITPVRGALPLQGLAPRSHTPMPPVSAATRRARRRPLPTAEATQNALLETQGNVARAAVLLGISRHQLNRLLRRHDLRPLRIEKVS